MYTSANKQLYDLFLEKLNENSFNVEFSGNFVFKFWQQGGGINEFEIIYKSPNEEDINYLTKEIVPVVDIQTIEIPFVEKNNRSDFEKELYIAVRIEYDVNEFNQRVIEFDEENEKFQAILETLNNIRNNLTYNYEGYKYTFKIKEPQKVNVFKYNGNYYQIFALNFNVSRVEKGFFGNEMKFYLAPFGNDEITEEHFLDVYEANIIVGKNTFVFNEVTDLPEDQKIKVNSRNWQAQIVVNFRGNEYYPDNVLFNELMANNKDNIINTYRFKQIQNNLSYEKIVYVTNLNATFRNNSLEQISFQLERV